MAVLRPPQYLDGHKLPFRVEIQLAAEGPFAVIIDADHRDVSIAGESFDDMLRYAETANARCTHTGTWRGITHTVSGPSLSTPERLDDGHPATRLPCVYGTAFECLAVGFHRHWITPLIHDELRAFKLVDARGEVPPHRLAQWLEWREAEDAELVRLGIHKAPTPVINAFRAVSRTHLTVVQ